jgi:manganese transport system ATP-binding protein
MLIEGRGVEVAYGSTVAVAASDFTIPSGSVTALIGPNGSGKSSLLNAIAGLAGDGLVAIGGVPAAEVRHRIAYVLQTTKVNEAIPVTVREVVAMGRFTTLGVFGRSGDLDRAAIDDAITRLRLGGIADRHLDELSAGERQRVFVAQGLAQDHDVLLLDEPFTAVDVVSSQAIEHAIAEERGTGCSVVMSTHDLAEASAADHVILLSGRIIAEGPPAAALTTDSLAAAYGTRFMRLDDGRFFIDDPAHAPVPGRHSHLERTIHPETPGVGLHDR